MGWGAALALCIGATQLGPLGSSDLFWHLACGRVILAERTLPARDPLTHTAGDRAWPHHEWGAQVVLAATDRVLGLWGLRGLRALLVALTLLGVAWLLASHTRSPAVEVAGVLLAWVGMAPFAAMRPALFGWAALVWILALLTPARPWRTWRYVAVAAAVVVWVNVHSSALILSVLVGAQLAGAVVEQAWRRRWTPGALVHWGLLFGIVSLAALVQPEGIGLYRYALAAPEINRELSTDWWPLLRADVWSAHPAVLLLFIALTGAVGGLGVTRRGRESVPEHRFPGFWVAVAALLLAAYTRRLSFLLFLPLLYVARSLGDAPWAVSARERAGHLSPVTAHLVAGGLLAAGMILSLPTDGGGVLRPEQLRAGRFPVAATRFLAATRLQGALFNPPSWGGYLAYRLYPEYRTFIDGRWLVVGRRVLRDSRRLRYRRQDVTPLLHRYHLAVFIQPTQEMLRRPPLPRASWRLAYVDPMAVVLVRRGPRYATNRDRICAWYRAEPGRRVHARWPLSLRHHSGTTAATDLRPVVDDCPTGPSNVRGPGG